MNIMKVRKILVWLMAIPVIIAALYSRFNVNENRPEQTQAGAVQTVATEEPELNGPYPVVRIVDGDTFIVYRYGAETRVRLIGVDTPESVNPDNSKNTEEGETASRWTKKLLTDQKVYLEYDLQPEDNYGRTLAYAYLEDGRMVQDLLLEAGMASTMTIQPNSKYANHFAEIQEQARLNKVGFWADE